MTVLSGHEMAKLQRAIKLHFEGTFDAVKYAFRTPLKRSTYDDSKTRYHFEKLAYKGYTEEQARDLFIANALEDKTFILKIDPELGLKYGMDKQNLQYTVERDLRRALDEYEVIDRAVNTGIPLSVIANKTSLLTAATIFWQFGGTSGCERVDPILWDGIKFKIDRLIPVLDLNWQTYLKLIQNTIYSFYRNV